MVLSFRFSDQVKSVMSRWLQHPWHPGPVGQKGATDTSDNNVSPSSVIYWGSETPQCQPSRSCRPCWPRSSSSPAAWRQSAHSPHFHHSRFSGLYSILSLRYLNNQYLTYPFVCIMVFIVAVLLCSIRQFCCLSGFQDEPHTGDSGILKCNFEEGTSLLKPTGWGVPLSMKPSDNKNFQQRARVDRRQRQPGPGHIVFRPNLGSASVHAGLKTVKTGPGGQAHKFSASQVINPIPVHETRNGVWSDVWGHGVTSEQLSVWLRGICHDVTKTRMDLEQFSAPSAPSLLIVCVCWGGNFLSSFQTWQSSNALGNDKFAIKLPTLRMYWHGTGYLFLILIACNLEWLLSRLVCQVVSAWCWWRDWIQRKTAAHGGTLLRQGLSRILMLLPDCKYHQSSDCVKNNWFDNCFLLCCISLRCIVDYIDKIYPIHPQDYNRTCSTL